LARSLADVAQRLRAQAGQPTQMAAVGDAFANIENALSDLAVAAERTAEAIIEADRPPDASPTRVAPTAHARALSWRLHALGRELRASRDVCAAVEPAAAANAWPRGPLGAVGCLPCGSSEGAPPGAREA
jgi:hypothetical protein